MKIFSSLLIFAIFSFSCQQRSPQVFEGEKFISRFSKVANDELSLKLYGQGGAFVDGVNLFHFHFISNEAVDVNQTRRFYLKTMDRLLEMINSNETLRPYLTHYPLTPRDIDLSISFCVNGISSQKPPHPYIAYVSSSNNLIHYSFLGRDRDGYVDPPSESIQRARGIVEHQNALMQIPEGCDWVK